MPNRVAYAKSFSLYLRQIAVGVRANPQRECSVRGRVWAAYVPVREHAGTRTHTRGRRCAISLLYTYIHLDVLTHT